MAAKSLAVRIVALCRGAELALHTLRRVVGRPKHFVVTVGHLEFALITHGCLLLSRGGK